MKPRPSHMFLNTVAYHARKRGRQHHRIGRFIPSTQRCSRCGDLTGPKGLTELGVRQWAYQCGAVHDRDVNAARNILQQGLTDLGLAPTTHAAVGLTEAQNARGETVRHARFGVRASPDEPGRIAGEAAAA